MSKKDIHLRIPVSPKQHAAITAWAARHGLSVAEAGRRALANLIPDLPLSKDQRGAHWQEKNLQAEYGRWLAENDDPQADESFEDFLRWKEANP
jgi:hypothetical protein